MISSLATLRALDAGNVPRSKALRIPGSKALTLAHRMTRKSVDLLDKVSSGLERKRERELFREFINLTFL
jgi:hypothetical protein